VKQKYQFVTDIFQIICAKLCNNGLSFVEDITKTIWCVFMPHSIVWYRQLLSL